MEILKGNKALLFTLITIILFSIIFAAITIFFNDIITLPSLKNVSREYYDWYMDMPTSDTEILVEEVTLFVRLIFSLIYLIEVLYILTTDKYLEAINKKNLLISISIGFGTHFFISYINSNAEHYRLFMTLIPIQIASLVLLNMILGLNKSLSNK